jgi:hypothetical protein
MKHTKLLLVSLLFGLLFIPNTRLSAQDEMDFELFMGMMSESINEKQLDELSFMLPLNIKVTGYANGDFSFDGENDLVIAIRDTKKTPKNSVDVYFFENIANQTYKLVKKQNYKYYEISLEVSFLVKEGKCYVTNRDDNNWYFTGYRIDQQELVQDEKEVFPIEFENAGN